MTTCDYIHSIQGCLSELYPPSHGPFSVRKTTSSHKIKSDTGLWTDMGSFLLSQVMVGHRIKTEAGLWTDMGSFLLSHVMVGHRIKTEAGLCTDMGSVFMSQVMVGHKIKTEAGWCTDVGSVFMSQVMAGHKIKTESRLCTDMGSFFMSQVMAARPQAQKAVLSFLHSPILLAILWPAVTEFIRNGFMLIQNPASHLILVTLVTSLMHILENGLMTSKIRWTVFGVNLTVCDERLNVFRVRLITFSVKKKVYVMKD